MSSSFYSLDQAPTEVPMLGHTKGNTKYDLFSYSLRILNSTSLRVKFDLNRLRFCSLTSSPEIISGAIEKRSNIIKRLNSFELQCILKQSWNGPEVQEKGGAA